MSEKEMMQLILDKVTGLETRMDGLETRMDGVEKKISGLETRMDGLELQIQRTENVLRNEIRKSESMVLDEVSRVHHIFEKHIADPHAHTA
ncbi:MAG: hypothetical protein ACI4LO_00790 [Anaerovoracaceae bacterium]